MPKYSIVIPVYNEEVYLADFFKKLKKALKAPEEFEIIFVNDGCNDYSGKILNYIADNNKFVRVVNLKQNYGKQLAITAGMEQAVGDAVIVLTIKPGSPFEALDALISSYQRGNEIVFAYRNKKQSRIKVMWQNFKRKCLNIVMRMFKIKGNLISRPDAELYDRKVVDVLNALKDKNMYLRRVDALFGFKRDYVAYDGEVLSKKELEEIKLHKFDFIGARISNNEREPKKLKKRFYIDSLWVSLALFLTTALLFIGTALEITFFNIPLLVLITVLITLATLLLSIIYYCKSLLIKRLGIMLPDNKLMYEVSSIIN